MNRYTLGIDRLVVLAVLLLLVACGRAGDELAALGFEKNEVVALPQGYDMDATQAFLQVIDFQDVDIQLQEQFADYEARLVHYYLVPLRLHRPGDEADRMLVKIDIEAPEGWPYRADLLQTLHADVLQYLNAYTERD